MKIDDISPLPGPRPLDPGQARDRVETNGTRAPAAERGAGQVTHLRPAGDGGQDIDAARVEELRQAISEGRLEIRAERIADRLIEGLRDLLGDTDQRRD